MKNALAIPAPSMPKGKMKPRPKEDTENRGELERLVIEPAENGFSVRAEFEPESIDPKFDRYNQMPEPEEMVFESVETALAYITTMMKGQADYEATEDVKPAGKKSKAAAPPPEAA